VAVMHNHGLTRIISTDYHFDRVAGIVRLDPQALWTQAQSAAEA
jgi:predicted nucleic acid-binding protein